jgi:hypothetical protein
MTMHTITITTRTLPPTDTEGKRVRVRTSEGFEADYPWDHAYDTPEVHDKVARQSVALGSPARTIEAFNLTESTAMGYTFTATVDD